METTTLQLYPHNRQALAKLTTMLENQQRAAIIQPTGTGKAFVAMQYIIEHPTMHVLWLTPSRIIFLNQLRSATELAPSIDFSRITVQTYAKAMLDARTGAKPQQADLIILDEYHHCGARHWGDGVRSILDGNPHAKIIGMSATPIRFGDNARDMTDELFNGSVAVCMSLTQAWLRGILPTPTYVIAGYKLDKSLPEWKRQVDALKDDERRIKALTRYDNLRRAVINVPALSSVFDEYLPAIAKIIVFCPSIPAVDMAETHAKEWFGETAKTYKIHSLVNGVERIVKTFEQDKQPCRKIIYAVDMLNEGVHIKDVDAIVMMRTTISPSVYLQQMGRVLASTGSRVPLIFDLVNNFASLGLSLDLNGQEDLFSDNMPYFPPRIYGLTVHDKLTDIRQIANELEHALHMSTDDKVNAVAQYLRNMKQKRLI